MLATSNIPRPPSSSTALFASSCSSTPDFSIGFVVGMTLGAVSFSAVYGRNRRVTARKIYPCRNQLQVPRPDAIRMNASAFFDMVPLKAPRRFTDEEVMGSQIFPGDANNAVPLNGASQPKSAAICTARVNFGPEALFGGKLGLHLNLHSGVTRQGATTSLPPLILERGPLPW